MDKAGFIIGFLLTAFGLYKIDMFLLPTLDYFGKYVFFVAINIFALWVLVMFYKKFENYLKTAMPILYGLLIMLIGVKIV